MVKSPVLFITFCRPEYARQTWEGIKSAQPKSLYFYSNKGRAEKDGEVERNNVIRSYINEIDWECDLHTWFRDECVNVYDSLRGAIEWLFNNEEQGIILEEDCVPTKAFFSYADQMLELFKFDQRIWCVSGDNFLDSDQIEYDYFFSHYHYMYGWASWADRWRHIDWETPWKKELFPQDLFSLLYKCKRQVTYRIKELEIIADFVNDTKCWDYLWGYTMDCHKALTVHPKYHLITNVGLCGAHHENEVLRPVNKVARPLFDTYQIKNIPTNIAADKEIDYLLFMKLQYKSFFRKAKSSLKYRIPLYFHKIKSIIR